jgi:hypothetical protein
MECGVEGGGMTRENVPERARVRHRGDRGCTRMESRMRRALMTRGWASAHELSPMICLLWMPITARMRATIFSWPQNMVNAVLVHRDCHPAGGIEGIGSARTLDSDDPCR